MKEELKKSLTDLIDETLLELEELKKSRFSAAEIDLKGPGADELAGKPVNGKLAEKAEDKKDDEDEDKKEDDKAEKAEGVNSAVDKAEGVNEAVDKAEDKKDEDKDEDKKDEPHKDDPKHEEKEKDMAKKLLDMHKGEMKKSQEDAETLMKSYVDTKVSALEGKLASILDAVTKLADAPVPAKGVGYKGAAAPLLKSEGDGEPLSKSEVASKLFELKKSGSRVDSNDIAMAEMGHDLEKIVSKYSIK
jgi:NADH dehydrogenase/NADH:ubiquinone oxidoreductase subunit G